MNTIGHPDATTPTTRRGLMLRLRALLLRLVLAILLLPLLPALSAPSWAGNVEQRVRASSTLRVCIWPDYYGITLRHPRTQQLQGIDIELSAALASQLRLRLEYVDSSFATLVEDVLSERCDVAMFAVGITPQRQGVLRFTRPYLRSDIYGITLSSQRRIQRWEDIDRPGVVVAVQAGSYMEPVMAGSLKSARLLVVKPPMTREQELESGRADVFMTDYPYSRRLLDNADWARLITPSTPFHLVSYGYAVKPGDDAWWKLIDDFVASIRRDGRLLNAARRFGLADIVVRD